MLAFKIVAVGEQWSVQLGDMAEVGGFPSHSDAAVWLMEYIFRMLNNAQQNEANKMREETRRQILGAALLAQEKKQ